MINIIKKGIWVKELSKIQKRREKIIEKKMEIHIFPTCFYDIRKSASHIDNAYELAEAITDLWFQRINPDDFNERMRQIYKIENATSYFEQLGNYFLVLSGNLEPINKLDKELEELKCKEEKLKRKLGIK